MLSALRSLATMRVPIVMPALDAGIHVFFAARAIERKTWMAGTSPAMTIACGLL